jgi:hypothetical protein
MVLVCVYVCVRNVRMVATMHAYRRVAHGGNHAYTRHIQYMQTGRSELCSLLHTKISACSLVHHKIT